jgi:hypothetical protein
MQTNLTVSGNRILGTLKFIEGGLSPAGPLSGDGYFMALKFDDSQVPSGVKVRVGLNPTYGTGSVELDEDKNAVLKVTDKNSQKFEVVYGTGADIVKDIYDLSGLVLSATDA